MGAGAGQLGPKQRAVLAQGHSAPLPQGCGNTGASEEGFSGPKLAEIPVGM